MKKFLVILLALAMMASFVSCSELGIDMDQFFAGVESGSEEQTETVIENSSETTTDENAVEATEDKVGETAEDKVVETTPKAEAPAEKAEETTEKMEETTAKSDESSEEVEVTTEKVEDTTEKAEETTEKIELTETPPAFVSGFVTTSITYIECEYILYEIDADCYVVGDLVERTDKLCRAMEELTGLSFKNDAYGGKKILVRIDKQGRATEDAEHSSVLPHSIPGVVQSARGDQCMHYVYACPGDLFVGDASSLHHELAHVLRFSQSDFEYNTVLEEGFAAFLEVKIGEYLEATDPEFGYSLGYSGNVKSGYACTHHNIHDNTLVYWFSKDQKYYRSVSVLYDNYNFGYRLMTYLYEEHEDFASWCAYLDASSGARALTPEEEVEILKACYGEDFEEKFYAWIEVHESDFRIEDIGHNLGVAHSNSAYDLTSVEKINIYPQFPNYYVSQLCLSGYDAKYKDLYINIAEAVRYLDEYKHRNTDDLTLVTSDAVTIQLFDAEGHLLAQTNAREISLDGVSYIKLVGEGTICQLQIVGFYKEDATIESETVLTSGMIDGMDDGRANTYSIMYLFNETNYEYEYETFFRADIQIVMKLDKPCARVEVIDVTWNKVTYEDVTEVDLSGARYFYVSNWEEEDIAFEITASPKA